MKTTNLYFEVHSDLYVAGRNEDGREVEAEVFFVTAAAENGQRWKHIAAWKGAERVIDEEGIPRYIDKTLEAMEAAERFMFRIKASDELNLFDYWREMNPVYGSAYYCSSGEEQEQMARERATG